MSTGFKRKRWAPTVQKRALALERRQLRKLGLSPRMSRPLPVSAPPSIIRYQQIHSGGEIKSLDTVNPTSTSASGYILFPFNTTPNITVLNNITIGSSMWNRQGRKVTMKSLRIRGAIAATTNGAAGVNPQFCRLIVVYDKQTNGAVPVYGDVFRDQLSSAADVNATIFLSGINLNNRDRFEVIIDDQWCLASTATGGAPAIVESGMTDGNVYGHKDYYRPLNNREEHFKADSSPGVIGDIATGSLILITVGSVASGSDGWGYYLGCRLRFSDL